MALKLKATPGLVSDYFQQFVNRRAYLLQSKRAHPKSGKHYYYRPTDKPTEQPLLLTEDTVRQHLEGAVTLGLFAINPATQRCKWVAIDADYKGAIEDLLKLQFRLRQDEVSAALEMSRRGGHLWIFFQTPQLARSCRVYLHSLAEGLRLPLKGTGRTEGIEIFPRQDELRAGEFGNGIRGPLGIHRGAGQRYWFYGADYSLEKQMSYLTGLRKVTEMELSKFIEGKTAPPDLSRQANHPSSQRRFERSGHLSFRILDYVTNAEKRGRNWWAQCPSCAAAGLDTSCDNLAISVEEPWKYRCWAGCSREMIRAAIGFPVPIGVRRIE